MTDNPMDNLSQAAALMGDAKRRLEAKIEAMVQDFERETGLRVESVRLDRGMVTEAVDGTGWVVARTEAPARIVIDTEVGGKE